VEKVRKDLSPLQRERSELGSSQPKEACPVGAATGKVDSNPGSTSTDPKGGTETPTASTTCGDRLHLKVALNQSSMITTPVKLQTCATTRATTTKFTNVETRRGAVERLTKLGVESKGDSNPYSLGGAVEGTTDPAELGGEACDARKEQSPNKQKKTPSSPTKVNVPSTVIEGGLAQFIGPRIEDDVVAGWKGGGASY
jgi:hypothetical protein